MTTLLKEFRNEFREGVLNFIWREWCRMGAAGSMRKRNEWIIDPEPVLAFTTEIARYDARVFDETLDWMLQNGQWINVQRLSTIAEKDSIGDRAVIGAIASWMTEHDKSAKWRGLARRMESEKRNAPELLFRSAVKGGSTAIDESDFHFERYGLIRPVVETRRMTQAVNMKDPVNAAFKCRALFGIGSRADVILYLLTSDGGNSRRISRLLGYNHMRVQELLAGLAQAGIVATREAGRAREYWIDRESWWGVVMGSGGIPRWIDWRGMFRGLTVLWRSVWSIDEERADDYIFSSEVRSAVRAARDDLHACGAGFSIQDDRGYSGEDYLPVFLRTMKGILSQLDSA